MVKYSIIACVAGFLLDIVFGDPQWSYHPIRLIGKLIEVCEKILRKVFPPTEKGLKWAGFFMAVIVLFVSGAAAFAVNAFFYGISIYAGIAAESIVCYFMIAAKALKKESMDVYSCIKEDNIIKGRKAVSRIVGRDTENLDEKGIIKAAVETVAENLSDGVIAPVIYMLMGGSVAGVLYKAVNTMDSMTGYKNERYIFFGFFPAKLDDILNFIPSRISAVMLILAAFILGMDYKNAIRIYKRDRFNHSSPNSAQTEAACAGALNIRLAGDAYYFGELYKKPYIGDCIKEVEAEDIVAVNRLMYLASVITLVIFAAFLMLALEVIL